MPMGVCVRLLSLWFYKKNMGVYGGRNIVATRSHVAKYDWANHRLGLAIVAANIRDRY